MRVERLVVGALLLSVMSRTIAQAQERWTPPDAALLARARAILREVPIIDTHNDLPYSIQGLLGSDPEKIDLRVRQPDHPADIPRLREGMVGAQFWSAYSASDSMFTGGSLRTVMNAIDIAHSFARRYPDVFEMAATADDIERIQRQGKIATMIGVEGGHAIENSLHVLRLFHQLGVRYMTLTHWLTTSWADASTDQPRNRGLTEFGEQVVREMNRLGIFVDLSHVSAETMRDAIRVSAAPVLYSHSNARAINAHPRNVPDDVLAMLPKNGGVVMINFIAAFVPRTGPAWTAKRDSVAEALRAALNDTAEITRRLVQWQVQNPEPRGTVADVADHIDHVRKVAGIDHIGIGSDFYDGNPASMSVGLEDPSKYPNLIAELLRRGYSETDVKKIAGLNLLRALRETEKTARLQGAARSSTPNQ